MALGLGTKVVITQEIAKKLWASSQHEAFLSKLCKDDKVDSWVDRICDTDNLDLLKEEIKASELDIEASELCRSIGAIILNSIKDKLNTITEPQEDIEITVTF